MNVYEVVTISAVVMGLGAVLGKVLPQVMAACQDFVESGVKMIARLFFVTKTMDDSDTQAVIYNYLSHKAKGYGNLDDRYEVRHDHIRPLGRKQCYYIRFTWHTWRMWFFKGAPIFMVPTAYEERPAFIYLRGTINWEKLVLDACDWDYQRDVERDAETKETRFKIVHLRGESEYGMMGMMKAKDEAPENAPKSNGMENYEPVGWRLEDIGPEQKDNPTDTLAMNSQMQEVVRQVEFWQSHEQWLKDREIPWKMGVLLYGPPGTGKTSLVRAVAMKLDMPVYSFDLSTMNSREFVKFWEKTRSERSRIILLEDIDTVFHGRENAIEGHRLSFDVLLNTIDGIEQDDGCLLFVTTNKVDLLDEALGKPNDEGESTRPGRIDLTFYIGKLDHAGRVKLALRILKDDVLAEKMALEFQDDTPVVFRQRCRRLATDILWGRVAA